MQPIDWNRVAVAPADLLTAAESIVPMDVTTCSWVRETRVRPDVYLEWAERGMAAGDEFGWATGLHYAKLAATRLIDGFLLANHLVPFLGATYPDKMDALRQLGLDVPRIVHDLVIGPRNKVEHDYAIVGEKEARHGVELARMFWRAVHDEHESDSIVAINSALRGGFSFGATGSQYWLNDVGPDPMVFVDVFGDEPTVKVVNRGACEILACPLARFTRMEAMALAAYLRRPWSRGRSRTGHASEFFVNARRDARL